MSIVQGRIDLHHHIIPPVYADAIYSHGLQLHAGAPLPTWTVEKSLAVMDANGIQRAITSLTTPGAHLGDGVGQASALARACNEYAADLTARYPDRFGSFALLPLPFTDAACAEAIHALDVLKADGVLMFGSADGVFLGDARFDELMAELNRRDALVFVHPNLHKTSEALDMQAPGFLIEFLCDTTRAAVNLMLTGTLDKYPRIRWILAHGGGFLPYVASRVGAAGLLAQWREQFPLGVAEAIKRFYFDTALSPSRYSMAALKALVDPSHIVFGSDFPFAPAPVTALQCQTLEQNPLWSAEQLYGIHRGNALALLPQYRQANEQRVALPIFIDEPVAGRIKRSLAGPMGAAVESIRSR